MTPIATLDEAMADPHFVAREMVLQRSDGSREYAPPFKVSGHAFAVSRRRLAAKVSTAPKYCGRRSYRATDIDALAATGVIRIS